MLRDVFDMALDTSPLGAVRAFRVRMWGPLFLILVWRAGGDVHELCDGYITPSLVIVSYPVTCFCESIGGEVSRFAEGKAAAAPCLS